MARVRTGAARTAARTSAPAPPDLPAWVAPVGYALVTVILFREFFFAGGLLLGTDTFALSYFARNFYTTFVHTFHRFPLWNPLLFGGIPFVDGMHGDIFYAPSLAMFGMDARTMWGWKLVLHIYAAGLLMYGWLRYIGRSRGAAFFGGLVFMMGSDLVSLVYPGGDGKLFVSALAPLMFLLTERCIRNRRISDFALFALGLALVVFTSHMQLAYFTVWGVSLYFLYRLAIVWRAERRPARTAGMLAAFAVAGVLGIGAAAVQFLPPLGYLREWSQRTSRTQADAETAYTYSTSYSLHQEEAAALIVPEFVGDNAATELRSGDRYWGRNGFKINNEYAGLVPLLLVPLLFLRRRSQATWFFSGLAVLSVLYGLGATTPLFRLFYLIPGVSLFRSPSLIIFLYGLSVATLGAMAVDRFIEWARTGEAGQSTRRVLWIVAGILVMLALAQSAGLVTGIWTSLFNTPAERLPSLDENMNLIRAGFWISAVLAIAVATLWEVLSRGIFGAREAVIALALLAAMDLYRVDRPFIRGTVLRGQLITSQDPSLFEPDEIIRFLQAAQSRGEVFRAYDVGNLMQSPTYGHNALAAHGIEQLAGHHGNEMARYKALIGDFDEAPNVAVSQLRLLNFTNVQYLISPQRLAEYPGLEEVFASGRGVIYRNANALPRAWLAGTVQVVPDERAIEHLLSPGFAPGETVVLSEPLPAGIEVSPSPAGQVTFAEREPDHFTLRVTSDRPALLVISDNYYPAWKAEIDGAPVGVLRANYAFRAIPVPAGDHEVRMFYSSDTLRQSATVSIVLLLVLLGAAATGLVPRRRGSA